VVDLGAGGGAGGARPTSRTLTPRRPRTSLRRFAWKSSTPSAPLRSRPPLASKTHPAHPPSSSRHPYPKSQSYLSKMKILPTPVSARRDRGVPLPRREHSRRRLASEPGGAAPSGADNVLSLSAAYDDTAALPVVAAVLFRVRSPCRIPPSAGASATLPPGWRSSSRTRFRVGVVPRPVRRALSASADARRRCGHRAAGYACVLGRRHAAVLEAVSRR
jgi:hypothetical protein